MPPWLKDAFEVSSLALLQGFLGILFGLGMFGLGKKIPNPGKAYFKFQTGVAIASVFISIPSHMFILVHRSGSNNFA